MSNRLTNCGSIIFVLTTLQLIQQQPLSGSPLNVPQSIIKSDGDGVGQLTESVVEVYQKLGQLTTTNDTTSGAKLTKISDEDYLQEEDEEEEESGEDFGCPYFKQSTYVYRTEWPSSKSVEKKNVPVPLTTTSPSKIIPDKKIQDSSINSQSQTIPHHHDMAGTMTPSTLKILKKNLTQPTLKVVVQPDNGSVNQSNLDDKIMVVDKSPPKTELLTSEPKSEIIQNIADKPVEPFEQKYFVKTTNKPIIIIDTETEKPPFQVEQSQNSDDLITTTPLPFTDDDEQVASGIEIMINFENHGNDDVVNKSGKEPQVQVEGSTVDENFMTTTTTTLPLKEENGEEKINITITDQKSLVPRGEEEWPPKKMTTAADTTISTDKKKNHEKIDGESKEKKFNDDSKVEKKVVVTKKPGGKKNKKEATDLSTFFRSLLPRSMDMENLFMVASTFFLKF